MRRHRFPSSDGSRYLTRPEVRQATAPPNLERFAQKSPYATWTFHWNKRLSQGQGRQGRGGQ